MGFCRRCGEFTTADRCTCGGHTRDSTTKKLFEGSLLGTGDKWSNRYLSRTSLALSSGILTPSPSTSMSTEAVIGSPSRTLLPPAARPPSPTKLAQSFLQQEDGAGELKSVFGSVLSPKDHWQCCACSVAFKQEETIYPHPDAKTSAQLAELFYCRQCFAERFRKGNCKSCKRAVLSDAPFVKHDNNLWHEACYSCSYCDNPSTSPVIDFAGRPSCEACFDAEAYLKQGLAPSPHLTQSEFLRAPISVPPAPSRWGRPSLAPPTRAKENVFPSSSSQQGPLVGLGVSKSSSPPNAPTFVSSSAGTKPKAWRLQQERDRSPMVSSLNELGDRLRQAGFEDSPRPNSPTKPATPALNTTGRPLEHKPSPFPLSTATTPRATTTVEAGPCTNASSELAALRTAPSSFPPSSPTTMPPISPPARRSRPVLAPVQPSAATPCFSPVPPTKASSSGPQSAKPAGVEPLEVDRCLVCGHQLGFGEVIELPETGDVIHRECFSCGGCSEQLSSGKHLEAEGKWYHKQCAPPPPRYRALLTGLAEPSLPDSSASPSAKEAPVTAELHADEPACLACGLLLGYGTSVTIPRSGNRFHQKCFTCAKCTMPLEKGFVEANGLAYHDKCAPPPASPSPGIRSSPFFAADANSSRTSRSSRPISLPTLPSFPPKVAPPASPAPSTQPSIFARRPRPPAGLGGLLVCAGCGTRATERETKQGPMARRYHPKCLSCGGCGRSLDSECRVGPDGGLRCGSCRKTQTRSSYHAANSAPLRPFASAEGR